MRFSSIVRRLDGLRARYGPEETAAKKAALRAAAKAPLGAPRSVAAYHDIALFLAAFPDDAEVSRLARAGLRRVAARVRDVRDARDARRGSHGAGPYDGSGIAHSRIEAAVTLDSARWLAARFPRQVDLVWQDDSLGDEFDECLRALLPPAEQDGLMVADLSTRDWFRLARGAGAGSDLPPLLSLFGAERGDDPLADRLFDASALTLTWTLDAPLASRTFNRFPSRRGRVARGALPRPASLDEELSRPRPEVRRLRAREAAAFIDAARAALCVRARETDPVTYASPNEVLLARLDAGVEVAVFGMRAARRLPLESYFGFVAARNGVPVAYGGGWVFLDRCEIGVNVFDEFRGGGSARLFSDVLRVYDAIFAPRLFTVSSYQIGDGNEDGIRSGAYWFYDRFGFRPMDPAAARLAGRERERIADDPRYRTPPRTLRRLARSRLARLAGPPDGSLRPAPDAPDLSIRVTAWIGRRFGGDRARARRTVAPHVACALGAETSRFSESERRAFDDLALLVGLVPGLARWSDAEKRALVRAMRAKGGPRELPYALGLRRHARLSDRLARLARTPLESIASPSTRRGGRNTRSL